MNRRQFLQFFGASVAAVTFSPKIESAIFIPDELPSVLPPFPDHPNPAEISFLKAFIVHGISETESRYALATIYRRDICVAQWGVNILGGHFTWWPAPGKELIHMHEHPLTFRTNHPLALWTAVFQQEQMYQIIGGEGNAPAFITM